MEIDITTQAEIYLMEAFVIVVGALWLMRRLFKVNVDQSKTHENAGLALPITYVILGTLWIYLRIAGVVSLPW